MENSGGRSNQQQRYARHEMNRCRCRYRAGGDTGCLMVILGLATIGAAVKYWYVVVPVLAVIVLFVVAHKNVDRLNAWNEKMAARNAKAKRQRATRKLSQRGQQ